MPKVPPRTATPLNPEQEAALDALDAAALQASAAGLTALFQVQVLPATRTSTPEGHETVAEWRVRTVLAQGSHYPLSGDLLGCFLHALTTTDPETAMAAMLGLMRPALALKVLDRLIERVGERWTQHRAEAADINPVPPEGSHDLTPDEVAFFATMRETLHLVIDATRPTEARTWPFVADAVRLLTANPEDEDGGRFHE